MHAAPAGPCISGPQQHLASSSCKASASKLHAIWACGGAGRHTSSWVRAAHTALPLACRCLQGNRRYIKCLYVYNKVDMCSMEEVDEIARWPNSIPISCSVQLNLDGLLERIWEMMALVSRLRGLHAHMTRCAGAGACGPAGAA